MLQKSNIHNLSFIVPIAFIIAYASTTFITPSPIEIPIDIWSRYMLYLPGSIMAGIGFLRQWREQSQSGNLDVSSLMLGAGLAFLMEAFVVGLVVPVAPYGPASYYNYNRVIQNAFVGENMDVLRPYGPSAWLDYNRVLEVTGFPIQFWRMISAFLVTFFVSRGLDVFDTLLRRQLGILQAERDRARETAYEAQLAARITAENWIGAQTIASGLRVPKSFADQIILNDLRESNGNAVSVSDEAILAAQKYLAYKEGIFAAPEGAATLAGLQKLMEENWVSPDERIVLFNTGTGLKYIHQGN